MMPRPRSPQNEPQAIKPRPSEMISVSLRLSARGRIRLKVGMWLVHLAARVLDIGPKDVKVTTE